MAESAEDMTAAETAPKPIIDTHCLQILSYYYVRFQNVTNQIPEELNIAILKEGSFARFLPE